MLQFYIVINTLTEGKSCMIINKNSEVTDIENKIILESNGYTYYCNGLIYIYGMRAGEESIRYLAEEYEKTGIIPFRKLHGAFSMIIKNPDGSASVFTDNSHMHALYIHENAVSDSFLKLIDYILLSEDCKLSLDIEAIAQQYCIGRTFFNKTLINEIALSDSFIFYYINNDRIEKRKKEIYDIDEEQNIIDPEEFFNYLSKALYGIKTSVALTGGYDSRLVYSFMKNKMPVQSTLSGDDESNIDIVISRKVARSIGDSLKLIRTVKPVVSDEILKEMFIIYDGSPDFVRDAGYRLYKYHVELGNDGYKVHLTGDGGVLHKDWEWMQDLPFYHKKNTDLARYYSQRLAYSYNNKYVGSLINKESVEMKNKIVSKLQKYKRSINTQSYDMLYYHVHGLRDVAYNQSVNGVIEYAPLLERDIVAYSYYLPRHRRFFYNNIRCMISRQNQIVSRIPTCYGTTASNEKLFVLRDIIFQMIDYSRKFIRMMGRKINGKSLLCGNVNTWTVSEDIVKLDCFKEALKFCKAYEIIDKNAEMSMLDKKQQECVLQVYFIAKYARIL